MKGNKTTLNQIADFSKQKWAKLTKISFLIRSDEVTYYYINVWHILPSQMKHLRNALLSTPVIIPKLDRLPIPNFQLNPFMKEFSVLK